METHYDLTEKRSVASKKMSLQYGFVVKVRKYTVDGAIPEYGC